MVKNSSLLRSFEIPFQDHTEIFRIKEYEPNAFYLYSNKRRGCIKPSELKENWTNKMWSSFLRALRIVVHLNNLQKTELIYHKSFHENGETVAADHWHVELGRFNLKTLLTFPLSIF